MANLEPLSRDEIPEFEPLLEMVEAVMGFVPNSMLTMARWPELLNSFAGLAAVVGGPGSVDRGLKHLVALMASRAAGCRYCQAHTSAGAVGAGVPEPKVTELWDFETSESFTDPERAALRLARDAAQVPNLAGPEHFVELERHFNSRQVVELVAQISLFGFLNRWNDTLATHLEGEPTAVAERVLGPTGWEPGKHGA